MRTTIRPLILSLFLTLPVLGIAADTGRPAAPEKPAPKTFDLSFPGGTLAELLQRIQASSQTPLNTMAPDDVLQTRIPAMELRAVTVDEVLESISVAHLAQAGRWAQMGNIWILQARLKTESREAKAYYVGHLLKKFSIEDITTAIRTTWELAPRGETAELKFHKETELLIALADSRGQTTAAAVMSELEKALNSPTSVSRIPSIRN